MSIYVSMLLCPLVVYLFYYTISRPKVNSLAAENNNLEIMDPKIPVIYAVLVFAYFIFWIGMRTYFADTINYISQFKSYSSDFGTAMSQADELGSKAKGFYIFTVFFKAFISDNFQWWLMFIAVFCGVCVMRTLYKHSCNFFYSAFLFIAIQSFMWMMNGMRQFIAVAALFAVSDWIIEGKFLPYLAVILLFSTVHTTCIMMIPIYFVVRCEPWSFKIVAFLGAVILISVFAEPFFNGLDSALEGTGYGGVTQQMASDDGVNPLRFLFYALPAGVAFLYRGTMSQESEKDPFLILCINMSVVAAALYFIAMFTSGILIGRLPVYCELYNLILIPFLLKKCFPERQKKLAAVLATLLFLAYFFLQMNGSRYVSDITGWVVR